MLKIKLGNQMAWMMNRGMRWLFLSIFFIFPFQKKNKILRSFSKLLVPQDASFPNFFSTSFFYYLSDILILAFAGLCLYRFRNTISEIFFRGPAKYLCALICIGLLSLGFSETPTYLLHYFRLFQFFLGALFFCAATAYIRTQNRLHLLTNIFWILCCTGVVEAMIAIAQYFSQAPLGLKAWGEVSMATFVFPMASGERWLIDSVFGITTGQPYLYRACGTLAHPNILGGFLFFSLMITSYLFVVEAKHRRLLQLALFMLTFALSVSFSRSAILATLLAFLIWAGWSFSRHFFVCKDPQIRRFVSLGLTLLCSAAISLSLLYSQFFHRGGIVNYNVVTQNADVERVIYQNIAWELFKESPLLGVGFNHFQFYTQSATPADYAFSLFSKVHNIYLLILSEMGILGALAFALFIATLLRAAWRAEKNHLTLMTLALFVGFLFIGMCDFYLIEGQQARILFFTVAVSLITAASYRQAPAPQVIYESS